MAKFVPFLGNLSGKLKSVVFAYNKAGSYVRSWRASTKPFSVAQLNAQAAFASAVTAWHALTDALKAQWNSYATTIFHAKNPVTGVAYSGYNAFVSMKNQVDNLVGLDQSITITTPAAATFTADFFQSVQTPPALGFSNSIQDAHGAPLGLQIDSIQFSLTDALFTHDWNLIGNTASGPGGSGPKFADAIGDEPSGIVLYGSKPNQQNNQFVKNPEFGILAAVPPIGQIDDWTDSPNITFESPASSNISDRKEFYKAGDIVQAKAFLVGKNGASQPLGAVKFTVDP